MPCQFYRDIFPYQDWLSTKQEVGRRQNNNLGFQPIDLEFANSVLAQPIQHVQQFLHNVDSHIQSKSSSLMLSIGVSPDLSPQSGSGSPNLPHVDNEYF